MTAAGLVPWWPGQCGHPPRQPCQWVAESRARAVLAAPAHLPGPFCWSRCRASGSILVLSGPVRRRDFSCSAGTRFRLWSWGDADAVRYGSRPDQGAGVDAGAVMAVRRGFAVRGSSA